MRGYWRDIGDPESYLAAHRDYFDGTMRIVPPGELRQIGGKPLWIEARRRSDPGVEVRATVVIGPGLPRGRRGPPAGRGARPGTVVDARSELRRTVTWEEVVINEGARIEEAVLGARVQVGAGTVVERAR